MRHVWLIAKFDLQLLLRDRWFLGLALAYAVLALATAVGAGSGPAVVGLAPLEQTGTALALLTALYVPLMALIVGAMHIAGPREDGFLSYLLAQPVTRRQLFLGHWLGLTLAVSMATLFAYGVAGLALAFYGGGEPLTYLVLCALALALALACLPIGLLISSRASTRTRALGMAIVIWLYLAFVGDLVLLGTVMTWRLPAETLLGLLAANPAAAFRVGVLVSVTGAGELAGPAAVYAVSRLGVNGAVLLSIATLVTWGIVAGLAGRLLFVRRSLP